MSERWSLRERVQQIAIAKKVGLHLNPRAEEIAKIEKILELQDHVMTELSKARGENIVKLWKLRGDLDE
jgi:hypothetical protein